MSRSPVFVIEIKLFVTGLIIACREFLDPPTSGAWNFFDTAPLPGITCQLLRQAFFKIADTYPGSIATTTIQPET